MKFVLAPDSFKESMTATEAAAAMARGVRRVLPDADCVEVPMADGGEGFDEALSRAWGADWVEVDTVDALGRPRRAGYGLAGDRAVIAMAASAGLEHIAPSDRDVARSSTIGLGLMVRDAIARGATRIVIGLGGSATNDAGAGMLHALGARLLDADGADVDPLPLELARVERVDTAALDALLAGVSLEVACDVTNPLTGPAGATAVFGPQKGLAAADIPRLDAALAHFARATGHEDAADAPGAGAAGGLGFALVALCDATLRQGVELVADATGLAAHVAGATLVLTGEGSVDEQTLDGKTPFGVARVALAHGVEAVVLAGRVKPGARALLDHGVTELVGIVAEGTPLPQALAEGAANLEAATERVIRDRFA